jgi:YD repeat-containing protein
VHSADAGARRGRNTNYTYDDAGQLTSEGVVAQTYDAKGNLISITDANLNTTTYVYDDADRLVEVIDALSQSTEYAYDGVKCNVDGGSTPVFPGRYQVWVEAEWYYRGRPGFDEDFSEEVFFE